MERSWLNQLYEPFLMLDYAQKNKSDKRSSLFDFFLSIEDKRFSKMGTFTAVINYYYSVWKESFSLVDLVYYQWLFTSVQNNTTIYKLIQRK